MDVTIKGLPVNERSVREMFEEICKIELADDVTFSYRSIGEIREAYTLGIVLCHLQTGSNRPKELLLV